ncbi:MAG: hypothetical protein ACLQKA_23960 [Bryobacteraceae bacterium]
MQVKPVLRTVTPRYPTHDYLREHPELLQIVPERWRQNRLVLRVLAGVGSLLLAVQTAAAQEHASTSASRIAPLFLHGEGRGAFGCEVVNPPVFLAEDEALQVIQDEARKAGLEFTKDAPTVHQATVPVTESYWCPQRESGSSPATQELDLTFDGFDKKHNVAFEFVSQKHFVAWEDKKTACYASVSSYDWKFTAEALRLGLAAAPRLPWVGVFYEPGATPTPRSERWHDREKKGREIGEAQLREQVRDFIQWLKGQGVI